MVRILDQIIFAILFFALVEQNCSVSPLARRSELKTDVDDATIRKVVDLVSDTRYLKHALDRIIVPRVVGTANHTAVIKYIVGELRNLDWDIEIDSFTDRTPFGSKTFSNIIATPNKNARRYLDLACHFDSKHYDRFIFHGATDSAVPCAMMLHLARSLNVELKKNRNDDLALRLIFFDGEEAFVSWTPNDSLYGSRHLAKAWESRPHPSVNGYTQLHAIDVLVLLDLLGTPNPKFYNFFPETLDAYRMLVNAQTKLNQKGLMYPQAKYFNKKSTASSIEDDHIPFLRRGVPIVHLIPMPFPQEWHTEHDNLDAIDFPTVDNLVKILAVFVADYLDLSLFTELSEDLEMCLRSNHFHCTGGRR